MESRYSRGNNQKVKTVSFRMPRALFDKVLEHHLSIASVCREAIETKIKWIERGLEGNKLPPGRNL